MTLEASKHARVVVIGAGAVGLAVAQRLSRDYETYILESGPRIAEGVTSRNSGVIHSPINYPPGSLKALLCLRGRELLYSWCASHGVAHRQVGKLVVATSGNEESELKRILEVAHANGAVETRLITAREVEELEPWAKGVSALFSPRTGIVDPYEFSRSLLISAEENGATLALSTQVLGAQASGSGYLLRTSNGEMESDIVINSAGLAADQVAQLIGVNRYQIYPWRGDYFSFLPGSPERKFSHLIYPVKMKSDPGLGVHLTLDLSGRYKLGPDVEFGSRRDDFSLSAERIEQKKGAFLEAAQNLFPWAEAQMLQYDTCGIRPKLRGPQDTGEKDFVISQDAPGWINLVGIESPGLTSAMAIAERVAQMIQSPRAG